MGSSPTPGARWGRRAARRWGFGRGDAEEAQAGGALRPEDAVVVVDDEGPDALAPDRSWSELRAIVAEAVVLQDVAEEVLAGARDGGSLGVLARRGGPLVSRFFALRDALPATQDPDVARLAAVARPVLHHHAMMVASALDLLAVAWRSERLREQLARLEGLGPPARRLDAVWAELQARAPRGA